MTNAEKQARKNAKRRAEKVAKGELADKPPLAPIEHRRLLNTLKGYLSGFDLADLKKVEAFIAAFNAMEAELRKPAATPAPATFTTTPPMTREQRRVTASPQNGLRSIRDHSH